MRIISGTMRGKKLKAAPESITRPTSDRAKESLFNIIENKIRNNNWMWRNIIFCDVFAGSGSVGLEAVSRGAKHVFLFENNKLALKYLKQNIAENTVLTVVTQDACLPPKAEQAAHIIFMDPPYGKELWQKALVDFDLKGWITPETQVIIEIDSNENYIMPKGWILLEERSYGRNKFLFLNKGV